MLTGPVEGRFLELLVHASGAKRVLEIGTFTGYSALSMAAALPEDGRIDTLRHRAAARRGRAAVLRPAVRTRSEITTPPRPALETIATLEGEFDFVFIDADKPSHDAYYEAVLPRLTARGVIAIDNTLWSGDVLDPQDERTKWIVAFNDKVAADSRVVAVMLTVRDGITLVGRR